MATWAQLALLAAAREFQRNWAAAPKESARVLKIQFEAQGSWKIVAWLARAAAIVAALRIAMASSQRRLVTEDRTPGMRLCAGALGRRGVHAGASFFLRRRIQERRLA
jgi:hypothetical protein